MIDLVWLRTKLLDFYLLARSWSVLPLGENIKSYVGALANFIYRETLWRNGA